MKRRITLIAPFLIATVLWGLSLMRAPLAQDNPHGNYTALTGSCAACHRTHTSSGAPLLNSSLPDNAFCYTCHNGIGAPAVPVVTHANVDFAEGVEAPFSLHCTQCHDPHGNPTNLYNIQEYVLVQDGAPPITTGPVVFTAITGTNSYDDGASDPASRICVTCHTNSANPGYPMVNHEGGANHLGGSDFSRQDCTTCHPHDPDGDSATLDGFMPAGGCSDCHSITQDNGDGIPMGGRRAVMGEFGATSHHVQGPSEDSDCLVCHETATHANGYVQLRDVDTLAIYDESTMGDFRPETITVTNSKALRPFCLSCHDSDGAGGDVTPFSDNQPVPPIDSTAWYASVHDTGGTFNAGYGCLGDGAGTGCHATGHGSASEKLMSNGAATITTTVTVDALCYKCHTEGMVQNAALSGSVDDIEEAFSLAEKHDLGASFSVDGNTYTLQCTTCHNPHLVTGKHWEVGSPGVSPVTRPDLTADPAANPRAMGSALWGATAGQKVDDFAARALGSGGWYFSTARGGLISFDQPAVYQPPKAAPGYTFEFGGDVLPDYPTLCLDCHTYRMSAANPPVNWGQGIACTGNSVDPPDQRIACNAPHGLGSANRPYYWGDVGLYGHSGNPDPIFSEPGVTRGRGAGHFMRWPYDSAYKNAGINFVMSCTDCHEAHGASAASMLRSTVNAYGPGTGNWNTMCNNCHYYYGGQHAGMSCATASCHEAASIHRIIKNGENSGATYLWTEPSRPATTPEIASVQGHIGSNELTVTFMQGVWTNMDQTGALAPQDFVLTDVGNDNPKMIAGVTHTPGAATAILTLSAPLVSADLGSDHLAANGISIWGTDILCKDPPSEATPNIPCPAGPWPVTIDGPPPAVITSVVGTVGFDRLLATFSEGVYSNPNRSGAVQPADLVLTDVGGNNPRGIAAVGHTAGGINAVITMTAPLAAADAGVDTVAAVADAIYDAFDNPVGTAPVLVDGSNCPVWGARFELNEPAGAITATDESGLLLGTVSTPTVVFQGDGYFHGDESRGTYIEFGNSAACLLSPSTTGYQQEVTLEARVKPDVVDLDSGDPNRNSTQQRIIERRRTFQLTIMRGDWWGDNVPERTGRARVMFKYRVPPAYRRDCGSEGLGAWMKQVASDIDLYPIVANHWYRIRVVFNSNKSHIPVDIWADDQGPNGDDVGENWAGFINIALPNPEDSGSCRWMSQPGDEMAAEEQLTYIGDNFNHGDVPGDSNNQLFKGLIDWATWRPVVDYAGIGDPPHAPQPPIPSRYIVYLPLILKSDERQPAPTPTPSPPVEPEPTQVSSQHRYIIYLPLIWRNAGPEPAP